MKKNNLIVFKFPSSIKISTIKGGIYNCKIDSLNTIEKSLDTLRHLEISNTEIFTPKGWLSIRKNLFGDWIEN